jgi:hypothetical protein
MPVAIKWILKQDVMMWTGFIWLRIKSFGEILETP